jgi:ASC-1-like (ASCH) protein
LKRKRPDYFEEILSGKKKFELRLADFEIKEGDTLVLREYDPKTKDYTGREIEKKVSYIIKTKGSGFHNHTPEEIEKYGWQIIQLD